MKQVKSCLIDRKKRRPLEIKVKVTKLFLFTIVLFICIVHSRHTINTLLYCADAVLFRGGK